MTSVKYVVGVVRFHRSMLVVGTIGVSIGASRVAVDVTELAGWLLIGGCGLLIVVADVAREIELDAGELAHSSGLDRSVARRDVFSATSRQPKLFLLGLSLALVLSVAAFALYGYDNDDASDENDKPTPMQPDAE